MVPVSALVRVSWNVIAKAPWGGEDLGSHFRLLFIADGSQEHSQAGQEPGEGADAEAMEGAAHWLAHMACSACFPVEPRTPAQGWPHPQQGRPSPVELCLRECPAGVLHRLFSVEGPSSQMPLASVQLTKGANVGGKLDVLITALNCKE